MEIKISVITVNYNNALGLEKTIKSVASQTYSDFEFIIIDGGSNDSSLDLIKSNDNKLKYWCSEPDKGVYNAMNKGVSAATGDYVIFMNSGDCFHTPTVLEEVASQINNEDIIVGYALVDNSKIQELHERNVMLMFLHGSFSHQATFIKQSLFENYRYDESLKIVSDWEAWIDWIIFQQKSYKYIETVVADYDYKGISSDTNNWQKIVEERKKVLYDRFPPLVLETLMEYDNIYLKGHIKHIQKYKIAESITFFIVKVIAYVCKKL